MSNYAILVNTTDSFEDCWNPFFTLFKKYWPDYTGNIFLNTESKIFSFEGLNIISVQNKENTWSECVRKSLEIIDEDYILYLQDDYFFKSSVKTQQIHNYFKLMISNRIDCLHLTDQHSSGSFLKSNIPDLVEIAQNAKDRVSCQAAFWKKDILVKYLFPNETGWHFETYGTMRSHYMRDRFFAVNHEIVRLNEFELIPYVFTGIVKGRWWYEVKTLFSKHEIDIDYSIRGFFEPIRKKLGARIHEKILREPKYWKTQLEIVKIRLSEKK